MCNFVIAELWGEKKKKQPRLCASVIPADTPSGVLLNAALSFHLFFRKAGYYKTVNIIGFTIPGTLVCAVRAEAIIAQCNEVELCVFFQFESFAFKAIISPSLITTLKKKLPLTFAHFSRF